MQPARPLSSIRLLKEAPRGAPREPRARDDEGATTKQGEACLVAHLAATACDNRGEAGQIFAVGDPLSVLANTTCAQRHPPLAGDRRCSVGRGGSRKPGGLAVGCLRLLALGSNRIGHANGRVASAHVAMPGLARLQAELASELRSPIPAPLDDRGPPTRVTATTDDADRGDACDAILLTTLLAVYKHLHLRREATRQVNLIVAICPHDACRTPLDPSERTQRPPRQPSSQVKLTHHLAVDLDIAARCVSAELIDEGATTALRVLGCPTCHFDCGSELLVAHKTVTQLERPDRKGCAPYLTAVIQERRTMHVGKGQNFSDVLC
mmetsp:Transcript_30168/g.76285  ORF Transcript_30168/g.76285 Transcript_30168/m.76285 type:complete len:323 (+) Transcript_30168:1164-2132(+)